MWRSTLPRLASILAALLLVVQNVPLVPGGAHRHCIHCTGAYCTRDHRCPHEHSADREHSADHEHGADGASQAGHVHASQQMPAHHGQHVAPSPRQQPAQQAAAEAGFRTCGGGPESVVLITLDKFVPADSSMKLPAVADRMYSEAPTGRSGRILSSDIFHPPAARV